VYKKSKQFFPLSKQLRPETAGTALKRPAPAMLCRVCFTGQASPPFYRPCFAGSFDML
jgi:hypothetical protein